MSSSAAQAAAVVTGAFTSGTMMALSQITVPIFLDTTTHPPLLLHQWARTYHYGHRVIPAMAVGTLFLYAYVALQKRKAGKSWGTFALAGVVTASIIPFTLIFMVPTNNELFRLEAASKTEPLVASTVQVTELIMRWSRLHLTRSVMPLIGAVMGVAGGLGE